MQDLPSISEIAKMIDHSLLHPTMSDTVIADGCILAKMYSVATVCVKPYSVVQAVDLLKVSDVDVCSVIGFPHGNSKTSVKVIETQEAMKDGAAEIDMVVNIGKAMGGDWKFVSNEISEINQITVEKGGLLKVIFETDYLDDSQIIELCEICSLIGVAFVKTSTGYGFVRQENGYYSYQGATEHNLRLMKINISPNIQLKAAGGVRTLDDLLAVRKLGVTRIGATATKEIINEAKKRGYEA